MHFLVASVTAASILAHALLGCCWHHAHGKPLPAHDTAGRVVASSHGAHRHCCHHASHESKKPENKDEHQPCGCNEERCTFVRTENPQTKILILESSLVLPVAEPLPSVGQLDSTFATDMATGRIASAPLHLLHRVLLI